MEKKSDEVVKVGSPIFCGSQKKSASVAAHVAAGGSQDPSGVGVAAGDGLKIGEIVYIDGLVSSPSLNGCVARIHGFDSQADRYMLEPAKGKGIKKFKRANFFTEDDPDDGDGASSFSGTGCHDEIKRCSNAAVGLGVLSAAPACR